MRGIKSAGKPTIIFKLQLRVNFDIIKVLDMGYYAFRYFYDSKIEKINFTSFEISIQRKSRQFFLGDSQGNVYHIGSILLNVPQRL